LINDVSLAVLAVLAGFLMWRFFKRYRERGRLLDELARTRDEIRTTLYSIGEGVVTADSEGRIRQINPLAERLLGWTEAEACGKPSADILKVVNEKTGAVVENPIARVLREGRSVELEEQCALVARDGRVFPISDSAAPIRGKDGSVTGVALVFRDQSADRAAQRELQTERDTLRAILDASPAAIIVVDESETVKDANLAAERLFDVRLGESDDRPLCAFLGCANAADEADQGRAIYCPTCVLRQALREVISTGQGVFDREVEYPCRMPGRESRRWISISAVEAKLDERRCLLIALNDVTRHRQTEAALKRIEWMLSKKPSAYGAEQAAARQTDADNAQERVSPDCRIGSAVSLAMLANIVSEFLELLGTASAVYEADGACVYQRSESGWCRLLAGILSEGEGSERRADGSAPGAPAKDGAAGWVVCAREARTRRAPCEMTCPGGMRLYTVPILVRGAVIGTIGFVYGDPTRDPIRIRELSDAYQLDFDELLREANAYDTRPHYIIEMAKGRLQTAAWLIGSLVETRQAEVERAKLETQFRHAQKMEAIGRLAGGIAHDFNNILQGIIGYGELLVERVPLAGEAQEFAREILVEAKRAATLTRQLLVFARRQASDPSVMDLNEAVIATLKMLRRLLGEDIELCWTPAAGRCLVKFDLSQLEQVLANLAVNARDAIDGVGRIALETAVVDVDRDASRFGRKPGRYVRLTFSDNGCGIEPAVMEHLFEPFFTTKTLGQGTGLGLATVYGIVEQNGGFITVASEKGQGTAFSIYLPEQTSEPVHPLPVPDQASEPHLFGTETILIVDDEEALLRSAKRMIESLGYSVLSASSPEEALRVAQSYHHEIHLLLTDVVMPGMSGRDLWLKLESSRPNMRCVFMSGYTANIIAQRGTLNAGISFLQKPFSKAALASKLREVLAAPLPS